MSGSEGLWNAKTSWNVCKVRTCRGPVEGPEGTVDFFDGSEAHCIECGREYIVYVNGDLAWLESVRRRKRVSVRKAV